MRIIHGSFVLDLRFFLLDNIAVLYRPFINGKVEEKTAGDGPSLATMFEDDRHLQGIIQRIKVNVSLALCGWSI